MSYPQGILPLLALKNTIVFPGLTQVIKVGRERSLKAIEFAEKNGFWIIAVQQKKGVDAAQVDPSDLYSVGTLCKIESIRGNSETGSQVVLRGLARVQLEDLRLHAGANFLEGNSTILDDQKDSLNESTERALLDGLKQLSIEILRLVPANTEQLEELVRGVEDLGYLTYLAVANLDISSQEKQKILEKSNLRERTLHLLTVMKEFREGLEVQNEIRTKLGQKLGQSQRQVILREQLKAIREELGEGGEQDGQDKLRTKLDEADFPTEVKETVENDWKRMSEMGAQSPEYHMLRNYLEVMANLPWAKGAPEKEIRLDDAERILAEDHYGLDKIKKRILQQLAVLKLKKETKGTLLLLAGPPGVGKTSLAQSIAKSLGRKFIRVSLGGVRDEADIRGHRRTYIGAMPGRIIQALKKVGENNAVFLLDEIDKLGHGAHGDPSAALLEVLDPEQNHTFVDHYLDVPFDLSKVLFLATANQLDTIPAPLLDRMEIVELSGYTTAEKLHIARKHLLPKQIKELGLESYRVQISDEALMRIISHYTREAGVRDLQRKISTVLRSISEKVVREIESNAEVSVRIEASMLEEILGPDRWTPEVAETMNPAGVVTGLAWSPTGGDILFIESTAMPGKGDLLITGQLGGVMKESAQIGLSLIRSHLPDLGLQLDMKKYDIHLHVPSGAIPKDGPSAGVSILTSMVSLLTGRSVSSKLAMTGEITLRGAVMPVGGIKEKVIAAHRAGITDVILPERNRRDLKEIPKEVLDQLKVHFVSRVEDLLHLVLGLDLNSWETRLLLETPRSEAMLPTQDPH